ncbi:MAG: Hsp70 family protein [Bacteroidetes bacterium]|nr:Hsp70 family protein [Bacteroidota bacterium]
MKKAIGIDLGTTNSVVAFKDTSVRILRNKENEELTRSCVSYKNGEFLVGRSAYQLLERDPHNTILSVKRLMGGAIKDPMVQKMKLDDYYKYTITSLQGGTENAVAVVLGGRQYTPEQLSAEILKKLKADAEARLDDEVTHAVITVPAYFTEKQKNATKVAAQLAGLKVQKLLAEPTAAAIAYGVDNLKAGQATTVLIYDFGGGTFDLSILNIADGNYLEAGTGGDRWLGGDDIDRKLQELILNKVATQYRISDVRKLIDSLTEKKKNQFEGQLRFKTEEAKIQLSGARTANIIIDNILEDEEGEIIDIDVVVTREELEAAIRPMIQRTIELINELLREVSYEMSMIDSILLVGGSSCIPLVKEMLTEKYGAAKIKMTEKPMLTVAEGAAILSHRLDDSYEMPDDSTGTIADVCYTSNHNYFIEFMDGDRVDYQRVIEKQMPLPMTSSSVFKTTTANQKIVRAAIFADAERGEKVLEGLGFYLIEQDLPIGSELTFDFTLDIDETYKLQVYPKGKKALAKNLTIARGNVDERAMSVMDEMIDRATREYSSVEGEQELIAYIGSRIAEINKLGTVPDETWHEIAYNVPEKFEEIKAGEDSWGVGERWTYRAGRLLSEFGDIVEPVDRNAMLEVASRIKAASDISEQDELGEHLKSLVKQYAILDLTLQVRSLADRIQNYPGTGIGITNKGQDVSQLNQNFNQLCNMIRAGRPIEDVHTLLDASYSIIDQYNSIL